MSHIPNSAMPHAGRMTSTGHQQTRPFRLGRSAGGMAAMVRANPGTTAAAGVLLLAGLAAAATPLFRKRASAAKTGRTRARRANR